MNGSFVRFAFACAAQQEWNCKTPMPQHNVPSDGVNVVDLPEAIDLAAGVFSGNPVCTPIAKALASRGVEKAANDNAEFTRENVASDQMLRAALRHFAEHGLGAAREARAQAEHAFFIGDRQAYDWWLGITRTLDRRMAAQASRLAPDNVTRITP